MCVCQLFPVSARDKEMHFSSLLWIYKHKSSTRTLPPAMDSAVILPKIRTSKRRVVANSNRKRALFSCDRCKIKKIACQRISQDGLLHDSKTPCVHCQKLNAECKTTIKRKKRVHGPIENIGLHYKCLITIMKGLYPEKDINNIDTLIELGENLNLKMPSRDGITKEEEEDLKDIAILLTSSKRKIHKHTSTFKQEEGEEDDDEEEEEESDIEQPNRKQQKQQLQEKIKQEVKGADAKRNTDDSLIIDQGGNTHYIGPLGAPAMATTVFAALLRNSSNKLTLRSLVRSKSWKSTSKEGIINSKQVPLNKSMFKSLDLENFPLLNLLNRKELDFYLTNFFKLIHPMVYCFAEQEFMKNYEYFWAMVDAMGGKSCNSRLSNSQVCCIYMVWILGKQMKPYSEDPESGGVTQFDELMMSRYIDVVKLVLSEMLLTPSLDGIRCLILLSMHMDNNKRRESGYVLIELLARQAISLGLNRKSLNTHVKLTSLMEEYKKTWWVVFKHELRFSNQMGRPTCLQIEDINLDPPIYETDAVYQSYVHEEIKLNQIMYEVLQYRKKLFLNYELLSLINMEKLINLKNSFMNWFADLPQSLKYDVDPKLYKSSLYIEYHYYFITLSLPFLLYSSVHNNLKLTNDDPILDMICQCVKSSISIAELVTFIDNNGFFNGTLYADLFYCYHASMALVLFSLLLHNTHNFDMLHLELKYGITLAKMSDSLQLIKILIMKNADSISGSLQVIAELIEVMTYDLEIIIRSKTSTQLNDTAPILPVPGQTGQLPQNQLLILLLLPVSQSFNHPEQQQQQQQPFNFEPNGNTGVNGAAALDNYDFNINFVIDDQIMLDNDIIDLLFGGDLLALYSGNGDVNNNTG